MAKTPPIGKYKQGASAVSVFKTMTPGFTAYARALTGNNKVRVALSSASGPSSSYTDGSTIYMRPPFALGDPTPHVRPLCDLRDPDTGTLRCVACATREGVLVRLYHEVSHIAFKSFAPVMASSARDILIKVGETLDTPYSREISKSLKWGDATTNFISLAQQVSEFLPPILNALEDSRVNSQMFKVREGTRKMFEAMDREVFTSGVEQPDGSIVLWRDYPLNLQIVIGIYCKVNGYNYSEYFTEKIVTDLDDVVLRDICLETANATSVRETFELSFRALVRFRELGYCKSEDDPDVEGDADDETGSGTGKADPENDDASDDAGDSASGAGSAGEPAETGGNEADPSDSDESPDDGSGDPSESEDLTDDGDKESDGDSRSDSGSADPEKSGSGDDDDRLGDDGSEPVADNPDATDTESKASSGTAGTGEGDDAGSESDDGDGEEGSGSTLASTGGGEESANYGASKEVAEVVKEFFGHGFDDSLKEEETTDEQEAVKSGIVQGQYFDTPSNGVINVREEYDKRFFGTRSYDCSIPESILSPALLRMRVAFADNKRSRDVVHLKSGKVNARVLGKRAWSEDERLFKKKIVPNKRSYFVVIGMDISGSTAGYALAMEKRAVLAQAELLSRMGIDFVVVCHSGDGKGDWRTSELELILKWIKTGDEPWGAEQRRRLAAVRSMAANLDGHTIEFYRKICDKSQATDKIIMYYTDGEMPCENYTEELALIQREISVCRRKGYTLMAVGVGSDDPNKYQLDTCRLDSEEDVIKVVRHLEKRMERA